MGKKRIDLAGKTMICLGLMLGIVGASAYAAQVKLTDGTTVSGTVVGRDGESIMLKLQRSSVASIDGKPLPAPVVAGSPAPAFSVVDLAGATQTLGSAKGDVTLLHFWASWCPHCRHDVDVMKDLYVRYQGKGVRIVTVSVDQDMKALETFLHEQQLPYPIVAAYAKLDAAESKLPDLYEMRGIPAYFLVDAHGSVAKVMAGSVTEGKVDLDGLIKGLLASSSAGPGTSPTPPPSKTLKDPPAQPGSHGA